MGRTMSGLEQMEGAYSRHKQKEKHRGIKVSENCKD